MIFGCFPKLRLSLVAMLLAAFPAALSAADQPVAPELQVADQFYLGIPKDGFGKNYLFSASLIPQSESPTSHGLAGKIVRFEQFPDGVDMYESTRGLVVTEDLPARRLLASFPIVKQDATRVVVDFNKGMRRVFTQSWTDGGALNFDAHDDVLEVPESRVFEMRADGGQLIIRQSLQTRSREENADVEARFEAIRRTPLPAQEEPDRALDLRERHLGREAAQLRPGEAERPAQRDGQPRPARPRELALDRVLALQQVQRGDLRTQLRAGFEQRPGQRGEPAQAERVTQLVDAGGARHGAEEGGRRFHRGHRTPRPLDRRPSVPIILVRDR